MKISASLYSNKNKKLEELVQELDAHKIDSFHIDCNDNPDVFKDIDRIREISRTPIDLHIISSEPEKYYDQIESRGIEFVEFQYENLKRKISPPKNGRTAYGLSIVSDSPVEVFEPYKDDFSFILLMTTTPGESGGVFRKDNFRKIRKFRNTYPDKKIHVDGGVNDEVSFILRNMGVNRVVSGSFLLNNLSIGAALVSMKIEDVHSMYRVGDFMIDFEDLPVLHIDNASFTTAIQTIDKYNLGFTFYVDDERKLKGLSSNADVRKGLIKNLGDLNNIKINDIINKNPVRISDEATISDVLTLVKNKEFLVNFLPVVNSKDQLVGALTFFNLIRGES